jgi:hypothetical protein
VKKWIALPCILLLAAAVAAQNDSSASEAPAQTDSSVPAGTAQPDSPVPAATVQPTSPVQPTVAQTVTAQPALPVPAGTAIMVRLDTTLATFSNQVGDPFQGKVTQPVVINGATVIPVGSTVEGRVTKVSEPRRISGRPTIGILPEAVILLSGERYYLDATLTDTNIRGTDVNEEGQFKGQTHDRRDTLEAGGGTAGGMLIGGLIGGGPGILIGGAIGAGSATAHWLAKHRSAILPAGTQLTLELNRPMGSATASGGSR